MSIFVTWARGRYDDRFSEAERTLKETWMPHIVEALQTNRHINLLRADTLARETHPVRALVDGHGVVHDGGADWTAMIRREWPDFDGQTVPATLRDAIAKGVDFRTCRKYDAISSRRAI